MPYRFFSDVTLGRPDAWDENGPLPRGALVGRSIRLCLQLITRVSGGDEQRLLIVRSNGSVKRKWLIRIRPPATFASCGLFSTAVRNHPIA
ncbi:hypothetical protein GCM10010214_43280 [Streptomyces abikoensis]|nr:hypothetical protein GCM10010214_43280 [Streptomyces abikoensis]